MESLLPNQLKDRLSPEQQAMLERLQAQVNEERKKRQRQQNPLEALEVYQVLRASIQDGMSLEQMVDAFQAMCKIPVGDPDDLLFETGTFGFTGENLFQFSLVRQFQHLNGDEYVQLHLDVMYVPTPETAVLQQTEWGSPPDNDFFTKVKRSFAFDHIQNAPIRKVEVYIDEAS